MQCNNIWNWSLKLSICGSLAQLISQSARWVVMIAMLDSICWIVQNDCGGKRLKRKSGCGDENPDSKAEAVPSSGKRVEQNTRAPSEPPKQDYIHVRARRGQATDSHSLAERVTSFLQSYRYLVIWLLGGSLMPEILMWFLLHLFILFKLMLHACILFDVNNELFYF